MKAMYKLFIWEDLPSSRSRKEKWNGAVESSKDSLVSRPSLQATDYWILKEAYQKDLRWPWKALCVGPFLNHVICKLSVDTVSSHTMYDRQPRTGLSCGPEPGTSNCPWMKLSKLHGTMWWYSDWNKKRDWEDSKSRYSDVPICKPVIIAMLAVIIVSIWNYIPPNTHINACPSCAWFCWEVTGSWTCQLHQRWYTDECIAGGTLGRWNLGRVSRSLRCAFEGLSCPLSLLSSLSLLPGHQRVADFFCYTF